MAQLKVELRIGISGAYQKDVIEVDDQELEECETHEDRENLLDEYWNDWANNYIDGHFELID